MSRAIILTLIVLSTSGCWNSEIDTLHLGDVSLGQQLIDLKRALDEDALNQAEYDTARAQLLSGADLCASAEDHEGIEIVIDDDDDEDDDD